MALRGLIRLEVGSLGSCVAPAPELLTGRPQKALPLTLKSKGKLDVAFRVPLTCVNDPAKGAGHADYDLSAVVDHAALGSGDAHSADDACPRQVRPPGVVDPFPNGKLVDKVAGRRGRTRPSVIPYSSTSS